MVEVQRATRVELVACVAIDAFGAGPPGYPAPVPLTDAERRLRDLLRLWTVLFGAGAVAFAAQPERTTAALGLLPGPSLPPSEERFWNALAVSLMATLTVLSATAAADVRARRGLVRPLLVSKAASTLMFLRRYRTPPRRTPYLAGAVCDGSILLATLRRYLAAR
jgi:hypothetical protein